MTRQYLKRNLYNLNPQHAEFITSQVTGNELEKLGITLKITTGFISGKADEYDNLFPVKDTIKVKVDGEDFGELIINGTNLQITPQYSLRESDFIQVSLATRGKHPLIKSYLNQRLPFSENVVGEKFYNFIILSSEDLENGANIILNKLASVITGARNKYNREERAFIGTVKSQYSSFKEYIELCEE